MTVSLPTAAALTLSPDDPRLKKIIREMDKYSRRPDALIQVLHLVQELFGFLPRELMALVSKEMHIAPSRVFGVATFYHFFSLKPKGEHTCVVCTGTACYVKGAQGLLDRVKKIYGLSASETTPDHRFSLDTARCIGSCGLAPAVVFDGQILAKVTPDQLDQAVGKVMRS